MTSAILSRRLMAVLVSLGVAAGLIGAPPAVAAAPWLTVSAGIVSFRIPAADVQATMGTVSSLVIEGNFGPSSAVAELGLGRSGDAWTSVIGPLRPGLYKYRLRGDDTKIMADPTNSAVVTSDPTWRTVLVPGDSARLLADVPAGQGGRIETVEFADPSASRTRTASVWTPPGYDASRESSYPTLYLVGAQAHTDWAELGRSKQILDNLVVQGRMEPMVVVMSDSYGDDSSPVLDELVKAIGLRYNVAIAPERQAIAGVSDGGMKTLRHVLTEPGEFAYVGSFGSLAISQQDTNLDAEAVNAATTLLRLYTGNRTDPAYNRTYQVLRTLDQAGVRHEFDGVNPDAGGDWTAWQENLADFLPRLFRTPTNHTPSPGHLPLSEEFTPPAPGTTPTPWLTKDANGDTFATVETGRDFSAAKHVTLWGNWAPGGSWVNVPMTLSGDRWRVTIGPLKPWFYYYKFIVDLASKKDTANPTRITTEPTWSTFLATGERARLLADVPAGQGGDVRTLTYTSTVAQQERSAYVWTPPGYNPRRANPYPVLYLQHGGGQNYTDWIEMGRAKQILDNLSRDGELVPMVVVMGNGNSSDFRRELRENIVPAARADYHVARDPAGQALAGLSMGGFQTYDVLKSYPGEFAYVGTFSAAADPAGWDVAAINRGTRLLQIYVGNETDFVHTAAVSTMAAFDQAGLRYEFSGFTAGPHGWDAWQKNLIDFAPRLFRPTPP